MTHKNTATKLVQESVHTPESLSELFNVSVRTETDGKIFSVEGTYEDAGGQLYGNCYYDRLVDVATSRWLTLRVPENFKPQLNNKNAYRLTGFLNRRLSSRSPIGVELSFHVTGLDKAAFKHQAADVWRVNLLQEKRAQGIKNLGHYLNGRFAKNDGIAVNLVLGHEAIIAEDVYKGLGAASEFFTVKEIRANLSDVQDIARAIAEADSDPDCLVAVARGGGDLQVFDSEQVARSLVVCRNITVAAIGHAEDHPFVEQVVDEVFSTPTDLGHRLRGFAEAFKSAEVKETQTQHALKRTQANLTKLQQEHEKLKQRLFSEENDVGIKQIESSLSDLQLSVRRALVSRHWSRTLAVFVLGMLTAVFLL